jgi:MscS family membrane protein
MGVDITAIITSLGIGGVIIGLAAKETISNFFDSIRLISEDAFHVGDWIETKDFEGFVTEIGLTATEIRTFENALIVIPNSRLANDWIKNWSRRIIGRRIKFWLKVKYTTDTEELQKVVREIRNMLQNHPQIVSDEKIKSKLRKKMQKNALFSIEDKYGVRKTLLVYVDNFNEYSIDILIYAFSITIDWEGWLKVKQDVMLKTLEIIRNSKLELAYPTQVIFYDERKNLWKD